MKLSFQKVVQIYKYPNKQVGTVKISASECLASEALTSTYRHPFYIKGLGFQALEDALHFRCSQNVNIYGVSVKDKNVLISDMVNQNKQEVFNLTVERTHTYFVGKVGVWVHNVCLDGILSGEVIGGGEYGTVYRVQDKVYKLYHEGLDSDFYFNNLNIS